MSENSKRRFRFNPWDWLSGDFLSAWWARRRPFSYWKRDVQYYLSRVARWGIILCLAYVAWKIVPVYVAAFRFQSNLNEFAREGAAAGLADYEIQEKILWEADKLDLPVSADDLHIDIAMEKQLLTDMRMVMVRVAYEVPVDLGPRQVVLNFHALGSGQAEVRSQEVDDLKKSVE